MAYSGTEYDPDAMVAVIEELLASPTGRPDLPPAHSLSIQAAPNPFNPQTQISFFLGQGQPVSLDIMDQRGLLVRRLLVSELRAAGTNVVLWNGRDSNDQALPSGLYLAQIKTRQGQAVTKLTLVQ